MSGGCIIGSDKSGRRLGTRASASAFGDRMCRMPTRKKLALYRRKRAWRIAKMLAGVGQTAVRVTFTRGGK